MTRFALFLVFTFSMFTIAPAIGADKFECPSPFKPNTPAKLEQVKGMLPAANATPDINQLTAIITALQREGMSKRLLQQQSMARRQ